MNPRQPHMGVPGQIMRQIAAIGTIDPVAPDVARSAALTCAEAATGAEDLRRLLDALGLGAA